MSEPFLAEIRLVGFNFAPRGWAFCDGQIMPINQNQSLYSLLGTTYGGDGRTSFALPDLRGRTPLHVGSSNGNDHALGNKAGAETITLSQDQMPNHDHNLKATSDAASAPTASGNVLGKASTQLYNTAQSLQTMNPAAVSSVGGNQAHNNMQPYLALNFCIALKGLFPSRN